MLANAVAVLLCAATARSDDFTPEFVRDQMALHGRWECLDSQDGERVEDGPWRAVDLPGPVKPGVVGRELLNTRFVWARKRFELDATQALRCAVLRWGGIRFGATAWINGTKVTEHAPVGPHLAMVPRGLLRAGSNELLLRIPGWAGVAKSRSGFPLVPTGASTQGWGSKAPAIEDDIWLDFHDGVYLKHVLALPDLGGSAVTFRVWAEGPAGEIELTAAVLDGASVVAGRRKLAVAVGREPFDVTVPLEGVKPWTPDACHLYTAELSAAAGDTRLDTVRFRFGMREISVKEGHYRLNGERLWLRGSNLVNEWRWGGRDSVFNRETKAYIVDEARSMNLNCFRTHTSPPPAGWLDVCDRNGTMIWAELPVLYNYGDFRFTREELEIFHGNALLDATGWVTKLWNHPSIVMWVLTNESRRDTSWESGAYHDHVLALDPTRPTMRTGCPVGTAENVDVHTCGNVSGGCEGDMIVACEAAARRKDPRRTLTNSEYMNFLGDRDAILARLSGDAKGIDAEMAYAELGMEHTEALRRLRYDGILPYMYAGWTHLRTGRQWRPEFPTPMAAALHSSMAPALASLDLFDRNFAAGGTVTTPLVLINETRSDIGATVEICVTATSPLLVPDEAALEGAVSRERLQVTFAAGSLDSRQVRWRVPEAEGRYYLAAVTRRPGARPVVSQREVHAIDPRKTAAGLRSPRVLLLGGTGTIDRWLRDAGIEHGADLARGEDADVVLVWDASRVEGRARVAVALRELAGKGKRVVLLDQSDWGFPGLADLTVREDRASRAFVCPGATHPVLAGIDPAFLLRWNGLPGGLSRAYVTGEPGRLLWAGGPDRAVLCRLAVGKGEVFVCQLMVRDRIAREEPQFDPVAERLLLNLIAR